MTGVRLSQVPANLQLTTLTVGGGSIGTDAFEVTGTSTFNGASVVSGASFGLSGSISAPAWTTAGIRYKNVSATLTDTTSSGTVANARTDNFGGNTIAASSATTFTNYFSAYFSNPVAGTNVTLTNKSAIGADSISINGATQGTDALAVTGTSTLGGKLTYGAASSAVFGTVGVGLIQSTFTQTDSATGAGTVAAAYGGRLNATTFATAANAITITNAYGLYLNDPVQGSNVTLSSKFAAGMDSLAVGTSTSTRFTVSTDGTTMFGRGQWQAGTSSIFDLGHAGGPAIQSVATSATVPAFTPVRSDATSGLGGVSGHSTLIAGGVNILDATSTTLTTSVSLTYSAASAGPILKQGANGRVGTFVANGVTPVTVNNTSIAITDAIIISLNTVGGTVGALPVIQTITASTGFTVAGTALDTSTYNYAIVKNAA